MTLETQRLELIPLTAGQLKDWLDDLPALERALDISYQGEALTGTFRDIVRGQCEITAREPEQYLWHSFWLLVRRRDRVAVGAADFKQPPNDRGEVEIGYGLAPAFEHHGYMTEAVAAMTAWALSQPGVRAVVAETERYNAASQHVLERCGFARYQSGETLWWRNPMSEDVRT